MKPSLSLILFTVGSGAGFGLFILMVIFNATELGTPLSRSEALSAGVLGMLLIVGGLISSTFHLANPRNAIKAFNRFRTSWLSREGVFSVLFLLAGAAYIVGIAVTGNAPGALVQTLGWLALILALMTLFSTGMIYASLKTIRQWHNPLVPPAYLVIGLASGGVLFTTLRLLGGAGNGTLAAMVTLCLLALAALIKLVYYFWIGKPEGPTLNTATGMTGARIRLLDVGHGSGNFLTEEFGHRLATGYSLVLRSLALAIGFAAPFAIVLAVLADAAPIALTLLAVAAVLLGAVLERWLFLIEGQHVVNLYHGRQRT